MKFQEFVFVYSVNDDNTVTVFINDNGTKRFYRAKARFNVLAALSQLPKETCIDAMFGIAYERATGLVLQLISYEDTTSSVK